jgi:hypothetical protein
MFVIRPGRDSDKPQILELIKDVFDEHQASRAEKHWQWQWHEDPRLEHPGYNGVVAEWNGRIIGSLSSIPSGLHIDGQPVPAHWHTDNIVHWGNLRRALRELKRSGGGEGPDLTNGVSAAMINFAAAPHYGQFGKHLTPGSEVACFKLGFVPVKDSGSWSRIVSFRPLLAEYAGKLLGLLLGSLADVVLPGIPKPAMDVQVLEGDFDGRFDVLWEAAKTAYPAITRRDSAVLNWRYRRHPEQAYSVLTTDGPNGLAGYLVYASFTRHRQRRAHIVDILADKDNTAARAALIAAALRRMKAEGVHKVECYATSPVLTANLKALGFSQRVHKGKSQGTLTRLRPETEYYFTRGDGDGG